MADPFIEEQFDAAGAAQYGASFTEVFATEMVETAGGRVYPRLRHPYPVRTWDFSTVRQRDDLINGLMSLYWRLYGGFGGFRLKDWDEYSTSGRIGIPTPTDSPATLVSGLTYQATKQYGSGAVLSVGKPYRNILKPVSGTLRAAIAGVEIGNSGRTRLTVDYTTGKFTFFSDITKSITSITQAAQAVIGVGASHGYLVNDPVHVSSVSGMTQINGMRGLVTAVGASTITVNINSSGFSAYTSGGTTHTAPQSGEVVASGCYFDFPVRFVSDMAPSHAYPTHDALTSIMLREMLAL